MGGTGKATTQTDIGGARPWWRPVLDMPQARRREGAARGDSVPQRRPVPDMPSATARRHRRVAAAGPWWRPVP